MSFSKQGCAGMHVLFLLFLVPSFTSGFMSSISHKETKKDKRNSRCPLCWAWASWWGNPAEHPKLQRYRDRFPFSDWHGEGLSSENPNYDFEILFGIFLSVVYMVLFRDGEGLSREPWHGYLFIYLTCLAILASWNLVLSALVVFGRLLCYYFFTVAAIWYIFYSFGIYSFSSTWQRAKPRTLPRLFYVISGTSSLFG